MSDLRLRLEGRLEVLESATSHLEALEQLLASGSWSHELALTRQHLTQWRSIHPRLEEAIAAAQRLQGTEPVERLQRARTRLRETIARRLGKTAVARASPENQLEVWLQLAEQTGLPVRLESPLAEAAVAVRSPGWIGIVGLAALMLLLRRFNEAITLVLVASIARRVIKEDFRYSLFTDALVLEREDEPAVEVPLQSLEATPARPGLTLGGLHDVEFQKDDALTALCAQLDKLRSERTVIQKQQRLLSTFGDARGVWIDARLQPDNGPRPAVEMIRFGKAQPPEPMTLGPNQASFRPALDGSALLSERGVLFIPVGAEPQVRTVLFQDPAIELLTAEERALTSLPPDFILQNLGLLRALRDVQWLDVADPLTWKGDESRERTVLRSGELSLRVDESSRALLRTLWP